MKLLDLTLTSPAENLALDEALLDAAESGESGEVLRFWESPEYFVVVGYANKVATETNLPACEARGVPILRRCSGGGTVVQGPGCLNYAVVLRICDDGPTRSITATNEYVMERTRAALQSAIGHRPSAISIQGHTDLVIGNRKCSGNSQRRRRHYLLFHGTFLLCFDLALVSELLPPPSSQPAYRQSRAHAEFVTNLNLDASTVKTTLATTWQANEPLENVPLATVASLAHSKYERPDWNFKF